MVDHTVHPGKDSVMAAADSIAVAVVAEDSTEVAAVGEDSIVVVGEDNMAVEHLGTGFELLDTVLEVVDYSIVADTVVAADWIYHLETP